MRDGTLLFPAINVNDSVTKSKFDNIYGCRHSLIDGLNRATDVMLGGKVAVVCGYGDVGKGCAQSLRGQGCRVVVTEIDPICALQAAMEGYQVATLDDVLSRPPTSSSPPPATSDIITADHMKRMKDKAIVGNIGHFDNEIDMAGLKKIPGIERTSTSSRSTTSGVFPDGHSASGAGRGPAAEPRLRHRPPELRDVGLSFTNQVLAQIALHRNRGEYETRQVYMLPKQLDEKVARLHLDALGVRLTALSREQADYIGVPVEGPYKPEHYRY